MSIRFISILCAVSAVTAVHASGPSFDDIVERMVASDPSLKAAAMQRSADLQLSASENSLPGPELEFDHKWGPADAGNKMEFGLTQEFELPGVYSARRKALRLQERAARLAGRSDAVSRRLEAAELLADIVASHKQLEVLQKRAALFDSLEHMYARARANGGDVTVLALSKIRIESVRTADALAARKAVYDSALASLRAFGVSDTLAESASRLSDYAPDTMLGYDEYMAIDRDRNPLVLAARAEAEASEARSRADRRGAMLPSFALGYRFAREGGANFHGFGISVKLPSWSAGKRTEAARLSSEGMRLEAESVMMMSAAQTASDYSKACILKERLDAFSKAAAIHEAEADLAKALAGGEISLSEYITESDYYLQAEQELLDLEYAYHLALIRLNRHVKVNFGL